jgi:molybdopterin molybdotransferase
MLSFDDARLRLLSGVARLSPERVPLSEAAGRVLAEDLVARDPLPRFDNSAMDGYAVSAESLDGEPPFALPVAGESSAGKPPSLLAPGSACRIFTGAPLPGGANTVVVQEAVRREGEMIRFDARPTAGQHVRRAGEDLARGAIAIRQGSRLSAGGIALAAMLGRAEVMVARRPQVTILCTGDELRRPGDEVGAASIPESNSAPIAALAVQAGAIVRVAPIARDQEDELTRAIEGALDGTDLLLTVGGVSVGDHDLVRPAFARAGVTLDFWRVAIKPGKPLAFGSSPRARVLGLPGNPASAIVTFALFGAPLLRILQGDAHPYATPVPAQLAAAQKRSPDRLVFASGALLRDGNRLLVRVHANQSSGAATGLASSDGLALLPAGPGSLEAGAVVDFVRWIDA